MSRLVGSWFLGLLFPDVFFLGEMWAQIPGVAGPRLVTKWPPVAAGLPQRVSREARLPVTHASSLSPPSSPAWQALSGGKKILFS